MELLEVSADGGLVFFCGHQGLPQLVSLSRNSATLRSSAPLTRNALFTGVRGRGILGSPFARSCIAPPVQARQHRLPGPGPEGKYPHVVVPHKDALACIGKGRRRGVISIDGHRYRSGRWPGGGGNRYATGGSDDGDPRCEIPGFRNLLGFALYASLSTEDAPLSSDDGPLMFANLLLVGRSQRQAPKLSH